MWRSGSETSTTYAENLHLWVPTSDATSVHILQGEHAVGMGFLLPTINIVLKQLNDFHQRNQNSLLLCELLANALIDGNNRRFEHLREKHDVQLAAVVNPKFKLDWVSDDIQKGKFIEMLKGRVRHLANRSTTEAGTDVRELTLTITLQGMTSFPVFLQHDSREWPAAKMICRLK